MNTFPKEQLAESLEGKTIFHDVLKNALLDMLIGGEDAFKFLKVGAHINAAMAINSAISAAGRLEQAVCQLLNLPKP